MQQSNKKIIKEFIKSNRRSLIYFGCCIAVWLLLAYLNNLAEEVVYYPVALWLFIGCIFALYNFYRYYTKCRMLEQLQNEITVSLRQFPEADDLIEEQYQAALTNIFQDCTKQVTELEQEKKDLVAYYTMWVHQIKTPIAGMRLLLEESDSAWTRELKGELFRIEQYVDMVLTYLRLNNGTNDFVLGEKPIAPIVKKSIKKFAGQFIRKKITLDLKELDGKVLTDEKWLGFIIEQLLSNALKYTHSGGKVTIGFADQTLRIADTGIGIAKEDLPRIFERNYTGYNGRLSEKSSGIGLYLCQKAVDKISGSIRVTSEVGKGTTFYIHLPRQDRKFE